MKYILLGAAVAWAMYIGDKYFFYMYNSFTFRIILMCIVLDDIPLLNENNGYV